MDRALYIAMSGAKQNTYGQTAHANNLANVAPQVSALITPKAGRKACSANTSHRVLTP